MKKKNNQQRSKASEERKQDLMNAALALFISQGFDQTPVEDICKKASVAKGTFYLYFPSKQGILSALKEHFIKDIHQKTIEEFVKNKNALWITKLALWLSCWVGHYLENIEIHNAIFQKNDLREYDIARETHILQPLTEILEKGDICKEWRVADPYCTAIFLFYGVHGVLDNTLILDPKPDKEKLLSAILQLTFSALQVDLTRLAQVKKEIDPTQQDKNSYKLDDSQL